MTTTYITTAVCNFESMQFGDQFLKLDAKSWFQDQKFQRQLCDVFVLDKLTLVLTTREALSQIHL